MNDKNMDSSGVDVLAMAEQLLADSHNLRTRLDDALNTHDAMQLQVDEAATHAFSGLKLCCNSILNLSNEEHGFTDNSSNLDRDTQETSASAFGSPVDGDPNASVDQRKPRWPSQADQDLFEFDTNNRKFSNQSSGDMIELWFDGSAENAEHDLSKASILQDGFPMMSKSITSPKQDSGPASTTEVQSVLPQHHHQREQHLRDETAALNRLLQRKLHVEAPHPNGSSQQAPPLPSDSTNNITHSLRSLSNSSPVKTCTTNANHTEGVVRQLEMHTDKNSHCQTKNSGDNHTGRREVHNAQVLPERRVSQPNTGSNCEDMESGNHEAGILNNDSKEPSSLSTRNPDRQKIIIMSCILLVLTILVVSFAIYENA